MGTLDLVERNAEGRLVVVDVKTAAQEVLRTSRSRSRLQLSIYSYATAMNGLADEADLRLRFDVLTKTKQPEFHRYWTTRNRAANVRLYRLAAEILAAVDAGVFPPAWAGTARTARSGAGAGRGGEWASDPLQHQPDPWVPQGSVSVVTLESFARARARQAPRPDSRAFLDRALTPGAGYLGLVGAREVSLALAPGGSPGPWSASGSPAPVEAAVIVSTCGSH